MEQKNINYNIRQQAYLSPEERVLGGVLADINEILKKADYMKPGMGIMVRSSYLDFRQYNYLQFLDGETDIMLNLLWRMIHEKYSELIETKDHKMNYCYHINNQLFLVGLDILQEHLDIHLSISIKCICDDLPKRTYFVGVY